MKNTGLVGKEFTCKKEGNKVRVLERLKTKTIGDILIIEFLDIQKDKRCKHRVEPILISDFYGEYL